MIKKILIATSGEIEGGSGISNYSKEIAVEFCRRGIQVHYVSPKPDNKTWIQTHNIKHFVTEIDQNDLEQASNLYSYIDDQKIDAIINNDNAIVQSLAPAVSVPFISVGHLDSTAISKVASYNSKWCDYVIAISNDMQDNYVNNLNIPLSKCPIIHNGVAIPCDYSPTIYKGDRKLNVLVAGEFTKRKGGDLIESLIKIRGDLWNKIDLNWYGSGLDDIKNKYSDHEGVIIHGRVHRSELLKALKRSDVFLLASRAEGCPMALLEAMSYGVVPIASNGIGAMRWLVTSGYDGYICSLDNWSEQAYECLRAMTQTPGLLEKMSKRIRMQFLNEFTIEKVTDKLIEFIETPTVDRTQPLKSIRIIKWHRSAPSLRKANLYERFCFRYGILRFAGSIEL